MLLNELFYTPTTFTVTIREARSNPGQNVKLSGHAAAVKFLQGKDQSQYGVSMTSIPKLGINPGSGYNTPVGIYYYPAEFYMSIKNKNSSNKLPFVDDAAYIQIFRLNGNTIDVNLMNAGQFKTYISDLYSNIHKIAQLIGESENNTQKMLNNAIAESISKAAHSDLYGGRLWYILYVLSNSIYNDDDKDDSGFDGFDESIFEENKRGAAAPRSAVIWNSLLRLLGIDDVVDTGAGIIHKNEPYQGVVLNPRTINHVETIENKDTSKIDAIGNKFVNLANMKVADDYVSNVIHYIRDLELTYDPSIRKHADKIVGNVVNYLRQHPNVYRRLDAMDIGVILQINRRADVVKELTVGLYTAKFPKVKQELDSMIEEWNDTKANFKADLPDARKKHAHTMIAPPYKTDLAKKTIRDLTPFRSDPAAAEIIDYLKNAVAALQY